MQSSLKCEVFTLSQLQSSLPLEVLRFSLPLWSSQDDLRLRRSSIHVEFSILFLTPVKPSFPFSVQQRFTVTHLPPLRRYLISIVDFFFFLFRTLNCPFHSSCDVESCVPSTVDCFIPVASGQLAGWPGAVFTQISLTPVHWRPSLPNFFSRQPLAHNPGQPTPPPPPSLTTTKEVQC